MKKIRIILAVLVMALIGFQACGPKAGDETTDGGKFPAAGKMGATTNARIQFRRGLAADLPALAAGEPGFTTDTRELYVGSAVGNIRVVGDYITPEMYGAKGDGTTDDTAAIQAGIDAIDPQGAVVFKANTNYLVKSTITRRLGVQLIGMGGWRAMATTGGGTDTTPQINFEPTVANDNLFELEAPRAGHSLSEGADIIGLTLVGNDDAGDAIHDDYPSRLRYSHLSIDSFDDGISLSSAMEVVVEDSVVRLCRNAAFRMRDDALSTTVRVDRCNLRESPWAAILEIDATINMVFNDTIFETCSVGGIDIYEGNREVNFIDCYSENVPDTAIASPIIQVGVNGTSSEAQWARTSISITGGIWAGYNGASHADSSFINADDAYLITVVGTKAARTGKWIVTTANTLRVASFGNSMVSITTTEAALYSLSRLTGQVPTNSTAGAVANLVNMGEGIYLHYYDGPYDKNWLIKAEYNATEPDLFFYANLTERLRLDALGRIRQPLAVSAPTAAADTYFQYSANAGAVDGQAGPHWRTEGGGIFGMRSDTGTTLQYTYQADALADDGTVALPDATSGMVLVSCNGEAGMWLVQTDGTVTKISGSTNTDAADTDAKLDVYDGGTGAIVKNRLGTTGEIRIVYYYN